MRNFLSLTLCLLGTAAAAQPLPPVAYPAGTSAAQMAVHERVRLAASNYAVSPTDVSCPSYAVSHTVPFGRDPDGAVRLMLRRECLAGIGSGPQGQ